MKGGGVHGGGPHIYIYGQKHLYTERKSRLQGTACWDPEVARDMNRTSNEINTRDVPHFLLVQAWIRLNEICPNFKDHIEDS